MTLGGIDLGTQVAGGKPAGKLVGQLHHGFMICARGGQVQPGKLAVVGPIAGRPAGQRVVERLESRGLLSIFDQRLRRVVRQGRTQAMVGPKATLPRRCAGRGLAPGGGIGSHPAA